LLVHQTTITKADRAALENLWGDAGAWAADTWTAHNAAHFDGRLRYHGIAFGLTPHGNNLAHTSPTGSRITLHPALLDPRGNAWVQEHLLGAAQAADTLLHEMVHVALFAAGVDNTQREPHHNTVEWCEQIMRITTELGLDPVKAAPIKPRRVDGKVARQELPGHLTRAQLASWPACLRPAGYYNREGRIHVPI
jgi:hypothetical protein